MTAISMGQSAAARWIPRLRTNQACGKWLSRDSMVNTGYMSIVSMFWRLCLGRNEGFIGSYPLSSQRRLTIDLYYRDLALRAQLLPTCFVSEALQFRW